LNTLLWNINIFLSINFECLFAIQQTFGSPFTISFIKVDSSKKAGSFTNVSSNDSEILKSIAEQVKELHTHVKNIHPHPFQHINNIYVNQSKERTHSSILTRKSVDQRSIPSYVMNGNAKCDKCFVVDLIRGFHCGENTDLCPECFNSAITMGKEEWVGFTI